MAAQWYCLIKEREHGPFTSEQIQKLAERGKLKPEHSVRPESDSHWTPASAIPGLFSDSEASSIAPIAKAAPPKVARKRSASGQNKPPPSGSSDVPQAIPVAGFPAATPVGSPVATPVAQPVAQPVATPIGTPVGTPIGTAMPVPGVPGAASSPATPGMGSRGSAEYAKRGQRKSKQLYIVVGALVGITVLLVGVAVVVVLKGPPTPAPKAGPSVAPTAPVADTESDPDTEAAAQAPSEVTFPSLGRWLDATRQKGGLRGVAKLEVADVWMEKTAAGDRILNVNVKVTNLASDESLNYRSWSSGGGSRVDTSALLADDQGEMLEPLPAKGQAVRGATTARRIKSDQSYTDHLRFSLADSTSSWFRLALPYAAIGHTGYLGFEIPILMIQDHPPGEEPPDTSATTAGASDEGSEGPDAVGANRPDKADGPDGTKSKKEPTEPASEAPTSGGQPATIKDLLRSIDDEADADADTDADAEPAGKELLP